LETMLQRYFAGQKEVQPSNVAFTAIIDAAFHSPRLGTTNHPDSTNEFASEVELDDPFSYAVQSYHELMTDKYKLGVSPDHFLFSTMLKATHVHTRPDSVERRQIVDQVFQDACLGGHVSAMVLYALQGACPNQNMLEKLLGQPFEGINSIKDLPHSWSHRVPNDNRFQRLRNAPNHRNHNKTSRSKSRMKPIGVEKENKPITQTQKQI